MTIFQRLTTGFLAIMFMVVSFGGYVVFQLNRLTGIIHLAAGADSQVVQLTESLSTRLAALVENYGLKESIQLYAQDPIAFRTLLNAPG